MLGVLGLLVLLSGAAALVDEVVWTRLLVHAVGSTAEAVASVLGAFLGGMALGAWILGRRAARTSRPLVLYAILEGTIALAALLFPWGAALLERALLALEPASGSGGAGFGVVRFAGVFLLLLPATAAMGGTIPVLCRVFARRDDSVGRGVGLLYAVNTLGAVLGCLGAGFVTIPSIGLQVSLRVAAATSAAVAFAALVLARRAGSVLPEARAASGGRGARESRPAMHAVSRPAIPVSARTAVLGAFALSGFTALGYEILWTRALVFHVKSLTYGFSFMLATFLAGLALGSAIASWIADRRTWAAPAFVFAELAAGITACTTLRLLLGDADRLRALAPSIGAGTVASAYAPLAFLVVATILPAGLFFGATFPLAARLVAPVAERAPNDVGRAAAANTAGAVLGAFVTGFWLVPEWGVAASTRVLGVLNMGAAAWVAWAALKGPLRAAGVGAALVTGVFLLPDGDFFGRSLASLRPGRLLYLDEGRDVTVTVHEEIDRGETIRTIYVNGSSYTGTRFFARRYMKSMGHLPLLLSERRERALVICLGTGMTLSALARHDEVGRVECAELSPGVFRALPLFDDVNDRVASNPRARVAIEDGRHFLLKSPTEWDVVTLEPPPPLNAGVNDLYSREFYELVRRRLAPGGIVCQWFPLHSQTPQEWKMGVATFLDVFPDATLWLPVGRNAVGIGVKEGGAPWTYARIAERAAEPRVAEALAAIGYPTAESLLASLVLDARAMRDLVGDAPLVTDDRPRLEFHDLAKAGERFDASAILREILGRRIDARAWLDAQERGEGIDVERWARASSAMERFFRGAYLFEVRQADAATQEWAEAYRIEPENAYWRSILGVEEADPFPASSDRAQGTAADQR